jgi:hypothetical protein
VDGDQVRFCCRLAGFPAQLGERSARPQGDGVKRRRPLSAADRGLDASRLTASGWITASKAARSPSVMISRLRTQIALASATADAARVAVSGGDVQRLRLAFICIPSFASSWCRALV